MISSKSLLALWLAIAKPIKLKPPVNTPDTIIATIVPFDIIFYLLKFIYLFHKGVCFLREQKERD